MIDIIFTSRGFDKVSCECAVLPVFYHKFPPKGSTALVDWRLNGQVSQILISSFFSGQPLESMIMPSHGRVKFPKLMFLGIGDPQQIDKTMISSWIDTVVTKLKFQQVQSFVICLSDIIDDRFEWRNNIRLLVSQLNDFKSLKNVFLCEKPNFIKEAKRRGMEFGPHAKVQFQLDS